MSGRGRSRPRVVAEGRAICLRARGGQCIRHGASQVAKVREDLADREDVRDLDRAARGQGLAHGRDLDRGREVVRVVRAERLGCCHRATLRRHRGQDVRHGAAEISATRRRRKAR